MCGSVYFTVYTSIYRVHSTLLCTLVFYRVFNTYFQNSSYALRVSMSFEVLTFFVPHSGFYKSKKNSDRKKIFLYFKNNFQIGQTWYCFVLLVPQYRPNRKTNTTFHLLLFDFEQLLLAILKT